MRTLLARSGAVLMIGSTLALALSGDARAQAPAEADPPAEAPANPEETGVRDLIKAVVAAFDAKDAEALGKLITDDILLVDAAGTATSGRQAVIDHYRTAFEESPDAAITGAVESVRFLTPDVARGEGGFTLDSAPGVMEPTTGRFALLAVRRDGTWRLAELRDTPAPVPAAARPEEHLLEVAWMIGDWVDESENARISSNVRWALNNNYIIRDYSIEITGEKPMTGMMILGYDPQAGQLKSWVFDSEGGQGEAYWTRVNENQWVLKARGRLSDGLPTSATQVITLLNKDVVRQNSLDRIIGGEVAPDITEVVMVRKPPEPSSTPAESTAPAPTEAPTSTPAETTTSAPAEAPPPSATQPEGR